MEYYTKEQLNAVKKQRAKCLAIYLIVLAIYVIASVANLVWYKLLPYGSTSVVTAKIIEYSLTVLFVIFSFIYLGIPFKRVNKYYKLCQHLESGIREEYQGEFIEYDEEKTIKDGVDMKALMFSEYNQVKRVNFDRKVLVFYEKPFPEIPQGAIVKFITQGNVLISYEIQQQKETKGE